MVHAKRFRVTTLVIAALFVAGCWGTKFALGPAAAVDKSFVGDWQCTDSDGKSYTLLVRNFDGKQYYVEFAEAGKPPERYSGFLADVKNVHFAHLRKLADDGDLPQEYIYMRVELASDGVPDTARSEQSVTKPPNRMA